MMDNLQSAILGACIPPIPPMPPMPPIPPPIPPPMPPAGVGAGVVGRSVTMASVVRTFAATRRSLSQAVLMVKPFLLEESGY